MLSVTYIVDSGVEVHVADHDRVLSKVLIRRKRDGGYCYRLVMDYFR